MSLDPHGLLRQVHPDLVKVIEHAAQQPVQFQVVYGIRTESAEEEDVASGHSQTLHSRHLPQPKEMFNGIEVSCAIDFCVVKDGKLNWEVADATGGAFGKVAKQIQAAADALAVPIQWGGAAVGAWTPDVVSHFRDWGHIQLPWKQYP